MNSVTKDMNTTKARTNDDFNSAAAITVMLILLIFVIASFYVLVSSYLDIN